MNELINSLKSKEVIMFCGAGISRDSGIPIVTEIKHKVLEKMGLSTDEQNVLLHHYSEIPFEYFMEALLKDTDPSSLLKIFEGGEPTLIHYFLAKMAKKKYINIILTTNFDTLIEGALNKENVKYQLIFNKEDIEKINYKTPIVKVIKLHGSVHDRNNLGITIKNIANKDNYLLIKNFFNKITRLQNYKSLLVMGYSCSDKFDINPAISKQNNKNKFIYFIKHTKDTDNTLPHPFSDYEGKKLYNTSKIINDLWEKILFDKKHKTKNNNIKQIQWTTYIDKWIDINSNGNKKLFFNFRLGNLFKYANRYKESNIYFSKIINDKESDCKSKIKAHISMGNNFRDLQSKPNLQSALSSYKEAEKLSKKHHFQKGRVSALLGMGIVYEDLKNHETALKKYEEVYNIAKDASLKEIEGKAIGNIGITLKNIGVTKNGKKRVKYLNNSLENHKKALDIAISIGDKRSEGRCLGNMGITYFELGKEDEAFKCYDKAYEISKDLGDVRHQAIWKYCYGRDILNNDINTGEQFIKDALRLFESINSEKDIITCKKKLKDIKQTK